MVNAHSFRAALRCLLPLIALTLAACHGGDDDGADPRPIIPAISSFTAASTVVTEGTATTLTAVFSNGSGVINNGVGAVTSKTAVATPDLGANTTFLLTVTSSTGDVVTSSVTVQVVPHPVINWLEATPASVQPGGTVALNASFGGGAGTISGPDGELGTMVSNVPFNTTVDENSTFTLEVTSPAGVTLTRTVDVAVSRFSATGSLATGRVNHFATVLEDGRVLITGGTATGSGSDVALTSAELYDPATGAFTETDSLPSDFKVTSATRLDDGQVLVVGLSIIPFATPVPGAHLFDPVSETFTATGSPLKSRIDYTATLLQDGMVLLIGGVGTTVPDNTAELYDPVAGTFRYTAGDESRNQSIYRNVSVLLASGDVLNCGGYNGNGPSTTSQCERYDPATETFSSAGNMVVARIGATATLLADGRVLIAGGLRDNVAMAGPEIYDPTAGTFTSTGVLASTAICEVTTLPDGLVLMVGLHNVGSSVPLENVLFDPDTAELTPVGQMVKSRDSCDYPLANLGDGRVLVSGGAGGTTPGDYAGSELFD